MKRFGVLDVGLVPLVKLAPLQTARYDLHCDLWQPIHHLAGRHHAHLWLGKPMWGFLGPRELHEVEREGALLGLMEGKGRSR